MTGPGGGGLVARSRAGIDCSGALLLLYLGPRVRDDGLLMGTPGAPSHMSDAELLRRIAQGDEHALGQLYDRFGATIFALASRIVGQQADAEEVTMEAFAQVWRGAATFDAGRGSVAAWLCVIARTRALDLLRSHSRRQRLVENAALEPQMDPPENLSVLDEERRQQVETALAALPPAQREAIELAYYQGLSQSEIADRLQQPLGTIKTRVRSGMQKLREVLRGYYFEGAV